MKYVPRLVLMLFFMACLSTLVRAAGLDIPAAESPEKVDAVRQRAAASDRGWVADLSKGGSGSLISGPIQTRLLGGRYRLHADLQLVPVGDLRTSAIRVTVQAGPQARSFSTLSFVDDKSFVPVEVDFQSPYLASTSISIGYEFDGKLAVQNELSAQVKKVSTKGPADMDMRDGKAGADADDLMSAPLVEKDGMVLIKDTQAIPTRLVAKGLWIEPLGPVWVESVTTDKITYKPSDHASVQAVIRNATAHPAKADVTVELVTAMDQVRPIQKLTVDLVPGSMVQWKDSIDLAGLHWGAMVRVTVKSGDFPASSSQATFGVADNFMELARYAPNTGTLEYENMGAARAKAADWRKQGFTAFESFFWGPCDMFYYAPKEEHFFGGQTGYVGSVQGTKNLIAACKEQGIAGTFYANLWGGSGPYALDLQREHPEWFGVAEFNTFVYDNYDMVYNGVARAPGIPWMNNQLNKPPSDEAFKLHARQIIESQKMFGWAGTRYDSYYSADWTKHATALVRQIVEKEIPDYRWGYNSIANADEHAGALDLMVGGGGTVMSEGIARIYGETPLAGYADYLISTRNLIWSHGGHHGPIYSTPVPEKKKNAVLIPLDEVYMACVQVATGCHTYYNHLESSVGDHMGFGLRFSQYIFNNAMRPVPDIDKVVDLGPDSARFFRWRAMAEAVSTDPTNHRIVLHLINVDDKYMIQGDPAMKTPPVVRDLSISLHLPPGSKVTGAWSAHASPKVECFALTVTGQGDSIKVALPSVRFYEMVVVEFSGGKGVETK